MTATKPLIFADNETKEIASNEIIQNLPARVSFQLRNRQQITLAQFCLEMNKQVRNNRDKNILIELNTINTAKQIFDSVSSNNHEIFFLSSQVIPKHRRPRISEIKERLESLKRIILVTTQVIEAGVDFDFDIAVRDIAPIDSIVQTAGRCNRNGKRNATESPFYIYRLVDDKSGHNIEFAKYVYGEVSIDIALSLLNTEKNIIDLVKSYYQETQKRKSNQQSDKVNTAISQLNYEDVEKEFQLLDKEFKMPVFVEYDENAITVWKRFVKLADDKKRKRTSESIQLRNEMEQYMIGVSEKDIQTANLHDVSGIYKINHNDIGILYDEERGFMSLN